jgi:signal transduction histidine kinase
MIYGDAETLEAGFLNLLLNSLDAVGEGGRIRLSTGNPPCPAGTPAFISVRVADDGPGIAPETRDRIFQPFFSTKPEGSGFGLPLALRTMEEHGGRLGLADTAGTLGGATFVAELPLLQEESDE